MKGDVFFGRWRLGSFHLVDIISSRHTGSWGLSYVYVIPLRGVAFRENWHWALLGLELACLEAYRMESCHFKLFRHRILCDCYVERYMQLAT